MGYKYADQLFARIDGVPVEIASASINISFAARKAVNTMNPKGRPLGTTQGVGEGSLTIEVPVRAGMPVWEDIEDSTILLEQRVPGTPDISLLGCHFQSLEPSADVEGEQRISVSLGVLDIKRGL